jgi:hypothetical protein
MQGRDRVVGSNDCGAGAGQARGDLLTGAGEKAGADQDIIGALAQLDADVGRGEVAGWCRGKAHDGCGAGAVRDRCSTRATAISASTVSCATSREAMWIGASA